MLQLFYRCRLFYWTAFLFYLRKIGENRKKSFIKQVKKPKIFILKSSCGFSNFKHIWKEFLETLLWALRFQSSSISRRVTDQNLKLYRGEEIVMMLLSSRKATHWAWNSNSNSIEREKAAGDEKSHFFQFCVNFRFQTAQVPTPKNPMKGD